MAVQSVADVPTSRALNMSGLSTAEFSFMGSRRRRRRRAAGRSPASVARIHPGTSGSRFAPPAGHGGAAHEVARQRTTDGGT
jgi:hypothetical protein